jgi:hypothetical protein
MNRLRIPTVLATLVLVGACRQAEHQPAETAKATLAPPAFEAPRLGVYVTN